MFKLLIIIQHSNCAVVKVKLACSVQMMSLSYFEYFPFPTMTVTEMSNVTLAIILWCAIANKSSPSAWLALHSDHHQVALWNITIEYRESLHVNQPISFQ